ncbi:remorin-like isoform X2 [Wolffia australiana]
MEIGETTRRWKGIGSYNEASVIPDEENLGQFAHPPAQKTLARVKTAKRISLAKAWEENKKAMIENRYHKELSAIISWENAKKADVELDMKKYEDLLEKKKAEYEEKMKNKEAKIHRRAEEKRAVVEANKGQALLKAEELAGKYREKGFNPRTVLFDCNCCLMNKYSLL